jgi:hypothetical protein
MLISHNKPNPLTPFPRREGVSAASKQITADARAAPEQHFNAHRLYCGPNRALPPRNLGQPVPVRGFPLQGGVGVAGYFDS